ncbi:MAG: hypothetical protein GXY94_00905 [Bacteroidales bacterium]|nr:hypothetical protein [Bacteroidales bacterium]
MGLRNILTKKGVEKVIADVYTPYGVVRVMGPPGFLEGYEFGDEVSLQGHTTQLVFAEVEGTK